MQMEMKSKDNVDPPESPINGLRCSDFGGNSERALSGPCDLEKQYYLDDSESFYDKLSALYDSSGLNLVLNVRETLVNLHVFYKEVTKRGGYYQVSKDKRWEEISVAIKLEGIKGKFPQQLQKAYAVFLYQFEQIYFYRAPEKPALGRGQGNTCSAAKRKSNLHANVDFRSEAKKLKDGSNSLFAGVMMEQKLSPPTPSKAKEAAKSQKTDRPKRIRTAYQIFIKRECERLRRCLGEKLVGQSFRYMADDAWRHLSEVDRQPYIEESSKDKEIFCQEMNALKELLTTATAEDPNTTGNGRLPDGDYVPVRVPDQAAAVGLDVEQTSSSLPPLVAVSVSALPDVQNN